MSFAEIWAFSRDALFAVLLTGGLCAFLGVYILLRRIVFVSAAVTQASGVGIALSFLLASFVPERAESLLFAPQLYAFSAGVVCALALSRAPGRGRLSPESRVGLWWVIAGALFLLVLSSKRIVQEAHQVDELLYGSAILVTRAQLLTSAVVVGVLLAGHLLFWKELVFISFDGEMASTLGYRTRLWDAALFASFGVGISIAVHTVGTLPAFGFLVIPGASAQLLVRRVAPAFLLAVIFSLASGVLGFYLSFAFEWPTGPALVAAAAVFLVPGLVVRAFGRT